VTNGAVVALNAVGFTLAYAVARQLNLAHGNLFALTTVVVASMAGALGVSASAPMLARLGALLLVTAIWRWRAEEQYAQRLPVRVHPNP
jgi:branched-subunit amino acid ABC-type transport system permease component